MDSKLVVEQMSGNWKIKHPVDEAAGRRGEPPGARPARRTPGCRARRTRTPTGWPTRRSTASATRADARAARWSSRCRDPRGLPREPDRGWGPPGGKPTTLILVRHGVTDRTTRKLFSGGLASSNPPLNDEGRAQVRATGGVAGPAVRHVRRAGRSPVRRTRETAEILAEFFDLEIEEEQGIAEMEFGTWDGMSFTEVHEKYPDEISLVAGRPRVGAARRRVVPRPWRSGCSKGATAMRGVVRREDGGRGQPRDPDQDPGRRRPRRAAGGGLPDGARTRVGHGDLLLHGRPRRATSRWPTCASTTLARPRSSADSLRSAAGRARSGPRTPPLPSKHWGHRFWERPLRRQRP